ncbi:Protein SRG1, partial [Mucuna pruriens]
MEELFNPSGTSLLVLSVQELAKQNLSTVPQRYIQPQHQDMLLISNELNDNLQIPIIDMNNLLSPEKVIGITNHSNLIGLTILLQVNDVEGLQLKKDGMWVPVRPFPNVFVVVNVGDILEITTNGIYRSIEHRAT